MAKIQITNTGDMVDAEISLEKALDVMKMDSTGLKEFEEPLLRTADEELYDIIRILRGRIVEEIKNIIAE